MGVNQGIPVADVAPWFGKSIIRSCSNMDYSTAQRIIDGVITEDMLSSGDIRTSCAALHLTCLLCVRRRPLRWVPMHAVPHTCGCAPIGS